MGSYHSSFTYLDKNSADEGLILASFEPDDGFVDSFLAMESIYTDSYDGTQRHMYGTKYTSVATINLTFIKRDGSDFSVNENRQIFKWLTGARTNSWLNFHTNDDLDYTGRPVVAYAFFGHFSDVQQRKMGGRVVGFQATFESIHPWAYSAPKTVDTVIGNDMLGFDDSGRVYKSQKQPYFGLDNNGVLFNDKTTESATFSIDANGVVYSDAYVTLVLENPTDDLYTYTDLDIEYINETADSFTIDNRALDKQEQILSVTAYDFTTTYVNPKIMLYPGTKYIVNFDGVEYICTPYWDTSSQVTIGNDYIYNTNQKNTFEPFVMKNSKNGLCVYVANTAIRHSFYVSKFDQLGLTTVTGLVDNEVVTISAGQFIVSDMPNKIFGDTFNFVFPKLCPGHNEIVIDGTGRGSIKFTYRYPIKIGDCAIDVEVFGGGGACAN